MNNDITLTSEQKIVLNKLKQFVSSNNSDRVFILKGYAGTGKTTLMRFFVKELEKSNREFLLLTPTGRAAKVLSNISNYKAETLHSVLYGLSGMNKIVSEKEINDYRKKIDSVNQLFLIFDAKTLISENYENNELIYESTIKSLKFKL